MLAVCRVCLSEPEQAEVQEIVAIVVSGSSTPREYIQRLGRVLRPKPGEAVLYELITRGTSEEHSSRRRRPKEEKEAEIPQDKAA